jgi:peptidylprolyl isomerase
MNPMLFAALLAAAPAAATTQPPASGASLVAVAPGPGEIVAKAPAADWVAIAPQDLLVMELAPDTKSRPRRVVIQLMPAPFSQGWVGNIRKLAAAHWWDGTAVTRVQDNYVAQWGDPASDDPAKVRKLPAGLATVGEGEYSVSRDVLKLMYLLGEAQARANPDVPPALKGRTDPYAADTLWLRGFPTATDQHAWWPVHCYGMVGVGRNLSPDTGSGAELYTVIGHAPRHLDRNIALVGRVIEGIEHLSSLPRGHGALGAYDLAQGDQLVPVRTIRAGTEVPRLPAYQYLSTESASFARYADARANRHDAFFIRPAGGADICNIPVPVRRAP